MASEVSRIAGQAVAKALMADAGSHDGTVVDRYTALLGQLSDPKARRAFNQYIVDTNPRLADALGIPATFVTEAQAARRATINEAYFAQTETRRELFENLFGLEVVAAALKSFGGDLSAATSVDWFVDAGGHHVALLAVVKSVSPEGIYTGKRLSQGKVVFSEDGKMNAFERLTDEAYKELYQKTWP